jgi:RND family efflux transporter MFP subunit
VCAADIALAKVQADRTRKLVAKQGATPQQLDEAEGRLAMARARGQMAEAAVVTAEAAARAAEASVKSVEARRTSRAAEVTETKAMLAFARIECPFERGVVTWRRLDPGALVRKDESVILELQRIDRVRVEFHVPERDVARVRVDTPVDLRFDALSGEPMQLAVSRTTRAINTSKVMVVQVDLENRDSPLLPGMYAYANLLLESADGVLTLPARALHSDGGGQHHVLVAVEGVARKVPVTVGADNGIRVQVDAGLSGGEAVIVAGNVKAGDPVRVTEVSK